MDRTYLGRPGERRSSPGRRFLCKEFCHVNAGVVKFDREVFDVLLRLRRLLRLQLLSRVQGLQRVSLLQELQELQGLHWVY